MKQNKLVSLKFAFLLLCLWMSVTNCRADRTSGSVGDLHFDLDVNSAHTEGVIIGIGINDMTVQSTGVLTIPSFVRILSGENVKVTGVSISSYGSSWGLDVVKTLNLPSPLLGNTMEYSFDLSRFTNLEGNVNIPEGVQNLICYNLSKLTGVHLPSTLKRIYMENCEQLTTVDCSATQLEEIYSFRKCTNLTHITVPPTLKSIHSEAFTDCPKLQAIDLSSTQMEKIEDATFRECSSLEEVKLPHGLKSIGQYAFYKCSKLKGISFPNSLQKLENSAFGDCSGMTGDLYLPDNITEIEYDAFHGCSNLDGTLHLPANLKRLTGGVFAECSKLHYDFAQLPQTLTSLGSSNFSGCMLFTGTPIIPPGVTQLQETFYSCGISGDVVIPNTVTYFGYRVFSACPNLRNATIPTTISEIGDGSFAFCKSLEKIHIPSNIKKLGRTVFIGSGIHEITIDEGLEEWEADFNGQFQDCVNLKSFRFPNSFKQWGHPDYPRWNQNDFTGCTSLEHVDLPTNPSVITIPINAFLFCKNLKEINIPDNIKCIHALAFAGCSSVSSLHLSANIEELHTECLSGLRNLKGKVVIPASLKKFALQGVFGLCPQLEAVTFEGGQKIEFIKDQFAGSTNSSSFNWYSCDSLKYVDMKNVDASSFTDNSLEISRNSSNLDDLFAGLEKYTMVYLPEGVPTANVKTGEENFVAGNPYTCENFVVYDNFMLSYNNWRQQHLKPACDYPIQYDFTATKANYKNRAFTGETCKTLYLPYPTALPAGMAAYELTRLNGSTVYQFTSITAPTLQANHPYLLRIEDGAASKSFAEEHGGSVPASPDITTTALTGTNDSGWRFMGTTVTIDNEPAANMHAYNLDADTWYPVRTDTPTGYIHPFRCFIQSTTGAAAKNFTMIFDNGKTPTAIDTVKAAEQAEADMKSGRYPFYTLDGRNMGSDYNSLPQGRIYIVNGHKFYKF